MANSFQPCVLFVLLKPSSSLPSPISLILFLTFWSEIGGLSKTPSFERNRPLSPREHHHHHQHESISPPPRRKQPRRPSHHQFPSMEHYWGHHSPPPPAPDPPHAAFSPAPSSTISSTISSSRSGVSSSGSKSSQASHWVKKVFELQPPSTPLTATGRR